jgi:hypothetical protein
MENQLVTLALNHWDKNKCYLICQVLVDINHNGIERIKYKALQRVTKAVNEFFEDKVTDEWDMLYPCDVKDIEPYFI